MKIVGIIILIGNDISKHLNKGDVDLVVEKNTTSYDFTYYQCVLCQRIELFFYD